MGIMTRTGFGGMTGAFYAFISFYLLNPGSNFNFIFILIYGILGMTYAFIYKVVLHLLGLAGFSLFTKKISIAHILSGAISGLTSGSVNILLSFPSFSVHQDKVMSFEFKRMVTIDILQYITGCILMGMFIGCLISYICFLKGRTGSDIDL